MWSFQGPEAFFEAQQHVATVLQKQHYPSFLVSDVCHRYITTLEEDMPDSADTANKGELSLKISQPTNSKRTCLSLPIRHIHLSCKEPIQLVFSSPEPLSSLVSL